MQSNKYETGKNVVNFFFHGKNLHYVQTNFHCVVLAYPGIDQLPSK